MAAGTITVNVQAKTAKAVGNLKKFQKSAKKTGKAARAGSRGVNLLAGKLRALGAAAAGALAAGLTARAFLSTAAALQKLNDTAAKLGISVNHLRQLQHAATITGVGVDTLNMALQRQVRRIAEAAQGTGEAAAALKELGLNAKTLNQLSPYEQFRLISQAMEKIPNQADKVRLSFKLWDSEGAALVNTLRLGSSGLDKIRRKFQRLGLNFNEIHLKRVERFNTALAELKLLTDVVGQKLVISLAPTVTDSLVALSEAIEGFRLVFLGWDNILKSNPWLQKLADALIWYQRNLTPLGWAQRGVGWAVSKVADQGMTGGTLSGNDQLAMARRTIQALEGIHHLRREQREDLRRAKETVVRLGSIP